MSQCVIIYLTKRKIGGSVIFNLDENPVEAKQLKRDYKDYYLYTGLKQGRAASSINLKKEINPESSAEKSNAFKLTESMKKLEAPNLLIPPRSVHYDFTSTASKWKSLDKDCNTDYKKLSTGFQRAIDSDKVI